MRVAIPLVLRWYLCMLVACHVPHFTPWLVLPLFSETRMPIQLPCSTGTPAFALEKAFCHLVS